MYNAQLMNEMLPERSARAKYKLASVRLAATLAKQIMESAKNENNLPLYPMPWSSDFIDLPMITSQRQPVVSAE